MGAPRHHVRRVSQAARTRRRMEILNARHAMRMSLPTAVRRPTRAHVPRVTAEMRTRRARAQAAQNVLRAVRTRCLMQTLNARHAMRMSLPTAVRRPTRAHVPRVTAEMRTRRARAQAAQNVLRAVRTRCLMQTLNARHAMRMSLPTAVRRTTRALAMMATLPLRVQAFLARLA